MVHRWLAAVLLLAATGSLGWGAGQRREAAILKANLESERRQAFHQLLGNVERLETLLSKAVVAGTPEQQTILLMQAWREANEARVALAGLPLAQLSLERTSRFLAQAGDFTYSLVRQNSRGESLRPDQRDKLAGLERQAASLNGDLHRMLRELDREGFAWSDVRFGPNGRETTPAAETAQKPASLIEARMAGFPTLTYDGPFSDHVERKAGQGPPKAVPGPAEKAVPPVSPTEAERIALDFIPFPRSGARARVLGKAQGKIPSYTVRVEPAPGTGRVAYLDVSRQGSTVVWMLAPRHISGSRLEAGEARDRALAFLEARGITGLEETSRLREGNALVFSFAAVAGGVILYPDLVKVRVALDNGEVVGYDATAYLVSHRPRMLPSPVLSAEAARARLGPGLEILGERLAVIPFPTGDEALAYEFRVHRDGARFLVYINAATGREEQILRVIPTAQGEVTM